MKSVLLGTAAVTALVLGLSSAEAQNPSSSGQTSGAGSPAAGHSDTGASTSGRAEGGRAGSDRAGEPSKAEGTTREKNETGAKSDSGSDAQHKASGSSDRSRGESGTAKPAEARDKPAQAGEDQHGAGKAHEPASGEPKSGSDRANQDKQGEPRSKTSDTKSSEKSGTGRADEKAGSHAGGKEEPSEHRNATGSGEPRTGGVRESDPNSGGGAGTRDADRDNRSGSRDTERSGAGASSSSRSDTVRDRETEGSVNLSREQETRVIRAFSEAYVSRSSSVDISVSVGASVPDRVDLRPLPPSIVEVVPQFRGYEYVVVRDEIVIVQPRTKKVVYVVHRSGGGHSSGRRSLHLTGERLTSVRRAVNSAPKVTREVRVEEHSTVPRGIELRRFPETIIEEVPDLRSYEYFVEQDDTVVVVDPDSREVIDILR